MIITKKDKETFELSCEKPIKGLILDIDGSDDAKWSDQAIDLLPGDNQTITAKKLVKVNGGKVEEGEIQVDEIKKRYLGDGSA